MPCSRPPRLLEGRPFRFDKPDGQAFASTFIGAMPTLIVDMGNGRNTMLGDGGPGMDDRVGWSRGAGQSPAGQCQSRGARHGS